MDRKQFETKAYGERVDALRVRYAEVLRLRDAVARLERENGAELTLSDSGIIRPNNILRNARVGSAI
jgi:hypothetical protein